VHLCIHHNHHHHNLSIVQVNGLKLIYPPTSQLFKSIFNAIQQNSRYRGDSKGSTSEDELAPGAKFAGNKKIRHGH
jgi:hypothetical protein